MKFLLSIFFAIITHSVCAQQIQLIDKTWFKQMRNNKQNDTLYIVNFWATWCKPCVEELPCFEQANAAHKNDKVKVLLVSNDTRKSLNDRLPKFIAEKNLKSRVLFMNETNPNTWIDLLSKDFSGAIPATWILRASTGQELFHEGELTCEELEKLITQLK